MPNDRRKQIKIRLQIHEGSVTMASFVFHREVGHMRTETVLGAAFRTYIPKPTFSAYHGNEAKPFDHRGADKGELSTFPHTLSSFRGRPSGRILASNPKLMAARSTHPTDLNGVPRFTHRRICSRGESIESSFTHGSHGVVQQAPTEARTRLSLTPQIGRHAAHQALTFCLRREPLCEYPQCIPHQDMREGFHGNDLAQTAKTHA